MASPMMMRHSVFFAILGDASTAAAVQAQAAWYATFRASVGQRVEGSLRLAKLEVTGSAASAKVVEDYPSSCYTDYLGLLRIAGRWWIVSKLYVAERR